MDRLAQELDEARQDLLPVWDEQRSAQLYAGARQLQKRRSVRRSVLGSVTTLLVLAGVALSWQQYGAVEGGQPIAQRNVHTLHLADGSRAELTGDLSELEVTHNSTSRVGLRLIAGRAHFDVVPNELRSFVIAADAYRVEVIGTVFDVERTAQALSVSVTRGKVRVYGPAGATDLVQGEHKKFSYQARAQAPAPSEPVLEAQPEPEQEPALEDERALAPRARAAKRAAEPSWRSLSQSGQYDAAYASLQRATSVENDPAVLMDAADAARLSGHPQNAVQYLDRVLREHRASPVAPLAAFTLGRVYLDRLGQPDKAAESFDLARRLAPSGSLAQDALAREVEALHKGGNAQKAYVQAREYLRLYPNGRRARAVQLYGGLE